MVDANAAVQASRAVTRVRTPEVTGIFRFVEENA
jgi:hypothetical protein